jgi:hypothetical protein
MSNRDVVRRVLGTVALVLAVAVAGASAGTLRLSNNAIRIAWRELTVRSLTEVRCEATMNGSFHERNVSKVEGELIGYITVAGANPRCWRGTLLFLTERLPWHIEYEAFTGMLPNIGQMLMRIIGVEIRTIEEIFFLSCLYRSTLASPLAVGFIREANNTITGLTINEAAKIPKAGGNSSCPQGAEVLTVGRVTVLESTQTIALTLI